MEDVASGDQEKDPSEESEPSLVPMKGVNRIAEEKTLGGRRGGQSQFNALKANVPSGPVTSISYNKKQSQFLQKKSIVSSSAAVQHEMSMGAQQTVKTIAISSNFSVPEIASEEDVEFLKMRFPAVGKKINVHFLCDTVLSMIEANPRHFGFGSDHNGREVVELLRPMVEALVKPEKPLLQAASLEDLTWMLEGKTVASEEEPFDLVQIVYQTADVVVCASASFGVKNSFRLKAISEELKNPLKRMERAVSIRTGWIYVAIHEEHLVRVIVVGQNAFSEKLTDLIVSNTQVEMFFHSQRPRDGIRTADWLDFPHKSSWFSGENPLAVDAMKNAIKVRAICSYFDTELATPLAKMAPYSQREKSSPNFIKEIFSPYRKKVAAIVVRSQKDVEERKEIAIQALGHFQGFTETVRCRRRRGCRRGEARHAEAFAR